MIISWHIKQIKLPLKITYIPKQLISTFIDYLAVDEITSDALLEDSIGTQVILSELFHDDSQVIYPAYDDYEFHDLPLTENHEQEFPRLQNVNWPIKNDKNPSQYQGLGNERTFEFT